MDKAFQLDVRKDSMNINVGKCGCCAGGLHGMTDCRQRTILETLRVNDVAPPKHLTQIEGHDFDLGDKRRCYVTQIYDQAMVLLYQDETTLDGVPYYAVVSPYQKLEPIRASVRLPSNRVKQIRV